jgi:hypothetical protein
LRVAEVVAQTEAGGSILLAGKRIAAVNAAPRDVARNLGQYTSVTP